MFNSLALLVALIPHQAYTLTVAGDVPTPLHLSLQDIEAMPSAKVSLTEHDGTHPNYQGAQLDQVLARAGLQMADHLRGKQLATYVLVTATDGYEVVFGLGEVEPSISGRTMILAYSADGADLKPSVGPIRLVVDGDKKPARCIRMVKEIDVVALRH